MNQEIPLRQDLELFEKSDTVSPESCNFVWPFYLFLLMTEKFEMTLHTTS